MYVIAIDGTPVVEARSPESKILQEEYVQQGKKVLVTTTTHMGLEPGHGFI